MDKNEAILTKDLSKLIQNVSSKLDKNEEKARKNNYEIAETVSNELDSLNLNDFKSKNDITLGLKDLEFDAGFKQNTLFTLNNFDFYGLRKRSHAQLVAGVANATYFAAIANKIRRNYFDIKNGQVKQKSSMLLTEINKEPGLKIGIVGGGKLGQQLARALIEFAGVQPSEIRISTRQPDLLTDLKSKQVMCFFNNAKLASSVNMLFLCVLPSQLPPILDEIKKCLPEKCIIYSFVPGFSENSLRNLLNETQCNKYIIKSNVAFNENADLLLPQWNNSLNIVESLCAMDMISLINPFSGDKEKSILQTNEYFKSKFVYSFINICVFMNLSKQETLNVLKVYLFHVPSKNVKVVESFFFDESQIKPNQEQFPLVNLVDAGLGPTALSAKFEKSKALRIALKNNFTSYFQGIAAWKTKPN